MSQSVFFRILSRRAGIEHLKLWSVGVLMATLSDPLLRPRVPGRYP